MVSEEPQNHWILELGGNLEIISLMDPWDWRALHPKSSRYYHLNAHLWSAANTEETQETKDSAMQWKDKPNSWKSYIQPKVFAGSKKPKPPPESCNLRQIRKAKGVFTNLANRVSHDIREKKPRTQISSHTWPAPDYIIYLLSSIALLGPQSINLPQRKEYMLQPLCW